MDRLWLFLALRGAFPAKLGHSVEIREILVGFIQEAFIKNEINFHRFESESIDIAIVCLNAKHVIHV